MDQILNMDSLKNLTPEQQNQLIAGIKQEAAIVNAQTLIMELSTKCTTKCITSPGATLSNSEKQCLNRCMDRFLESWNLVSVSLQKRLKEESMRLGGASQLVTGISTPAPIFEGSEPSFS